MIDLSFTSFTSSRLQDPLMFYYVWGFCVDTTTSSKAWEAIQVLVELQVDEVVLLKLNQGLLVTQRDLDPF